MTETRERFIEAATKAFAARGFYGTSIASIADELPYTKQALLHHFGSKEKLYAQVLKRISDRLIAELDAVHSRYSDARTRVEETFVAVYLSATQHRDDIQLLMRELLDNRRRAEAARTWYLKPFLQTLVRAIMDAAAPTIRSKQTALAVAYQLLGAINYFVVSEPTLTRMFGRQEYQRVRRRYDQELRHLIAARLDWHP